VAKGEAFRASAALSAVAFLLFAASSTLVLAADEPAGAEEAPNLALDKAIAALKHVQPEKMTTAEKEIQAAAVERSWKMIKAAGKDGLLKLKGELKGVEEGKEKDDFFKLNAAALLWQIGSLDEAQTIAGIWASTPLTANYNYVFYPAFEAAMTHDERALTMLKACLKDDSGTVSVAAHSLGLRWPMTMVFIWGAYGPAGLPVLASILNNSREPVELQAAALLLSEAQYLEALPGIRKLAREGYSPGQRPPSVRLMAVECLALFGHPQDYEFLIEGLRSENADTARHYVYALHEYEDLRAVPHLTPLLKSGDAPLRREVVGALLHLLTPESLEALHEHARAAKSEDERDECQRTVERLMDALNLPWDQYAAKSPEQKKDLLAGLRGRADTIRGPGGSPQLTRGDFLAMLARWQRQHRLDAGSFKWDEGQLLSVATADDINRLLDVRAAIYTRLSDECISEAATIDEAVRLLGRSRYRRESGLTEKAELQEG
jgi:HEAT repeat protein